MAKPKIKIIDVDDEEGQSIVIRKGGKDYRVSFSVLEKEEVKLYVGFGWLTCDELLELRQTEPRLAP